MIIFCPNCSERVDHRAQDCPSCGTPIAAIYDPLHVAPRGPAAAPTLVGAFALGALATPVKIVAVILMMLGIVGIVIGAWSGWPCMIGGLVANGAACYMRYVSDQTIRIGR